MGMTLRAWAFAVTIALLAPPVVGQEAKIAFGALEQDTSLPVEIAADQLSVNNADGTAVFSGNVVVVQGPMTLSAAEVLVKYAADGQSIDQLIASGGVKITNLADSAVGKEAVYSVATGAIELSGDVVLTQGSSSMKGQKLTINLNDGTGVMSGRVTTTFAPGGD
jgi:lipopolysaccharide export system protein LptA